MGPGEQQGEGHRSAMPPQSRKGRRVPRAAAKRSLNRPVIGFKITSHALGKKTIKPAISAEMPNESVR